MPLTALLWALFVVPVWMVLARLPAGLAGEDAPTGPLLVAGIVAATVLVFFADRRFGTPGPPRYFLPDRVWWLAPALIGGLGFTIIASELGNVGAHLADVPLPDPQSEPVDDPLLTGVLSIAFRAGLVLVIVGVVERTLLAIQKPWTAIIVTALIGAIPAPLHLWPQLALLMGFPAWLFCHTRSMALAVTGYLPMIAVPVLELAGISLGIQGFDTFDAGPKPFQPVWFNLLGAVLIAVGSGLLLRAFETEAALDALDAPSGGGDRSGD